MARLKRALAPLEAAQTSFQEGHYQQALDQALRLAVRSGPNWPAAAILASRIYLRIGKPEEAVELLEPARRRDPQDATVGILLGVAYFRLGDKATGVAMIENAHRLSSNDEERAEAAYYRSWVAYIERDLETAERWAASSLDEASGVVYARGLALSGWISEARGDYPATIRAHRLALSALRNGDTHDDELGARIVHGLALFAAETPDRALADFVRAQADAIAWPDSESPHRLQTMLHLAIARVNEGAVEEALDELGAHETMARAQPAFEAQARLESADVYRLLGEPVAARRSLRSAAEALRRVNWTVAGIDDTMALLESACLAARLDPTSASEWIARYAATSKNDPGWSALKDDPRVQALELHARGLVDVAVADRKRGIKRLHQAMEIWDRLGYRRRAAYAEADLAGAGEASSAARILALMSKAPMNPLRRASTAHTKESDKIVSAAGAYPELLPSETRVLDALCAGMSVREMADAWGRSAYTIRNHLKRLFVKFGVTSSAALVAKTLRASSSASLAPTKRGLV